MHRIDSRDFCKDAERQLDRAEAETVIITRDDEPTWALVSYEVFSHLRRGNRTALQASALSDEEVAGIRNARMAPEHDHLNSELDDDREDTKK